ncbi:hypothetical protein FAS41_05180 [Pseudomonas nicosulfuronedens]|uniref:Zinc-ribbon domain-containing protein n=1 Tax=Pseudomonas nicosulfuronedens TaxID=2571105 RepID=A0A5R9RAU0_9PSED|nr:hypothetical protein [Pseudomonas nicosulfuronedens]TLX80284.1 hypothetical protein FAS41_05180 [Pseudomonas nicosulfuronedens]
MSRTLTYPHETSAQARYDHLQAEVARVGMERLGEWKGFDSTYWFRCRKGHEIKRYMRPFTQQSKLPECQTCLKTQRLQLLRSTARTAGIRLLSKEWLGEKTNHHFRCAQGHTWERTGRTALANISCPVCNNGRLKLADTLLLKDGLKRLRQAAKRRGGNCLSDQYLGLMRKYDFRCAKGHVWQARGSSVMKDNLWCPYCSHRPIDLAVWQMDGLARLHEAAARHGGECLADEYVGANPRYRFRCIQGHEWETKAAHVLAGSWCKACLTQSQRLTLEDARRIAAERGGQCLSAEYIRCQEKLHWLCHRGHSWHSAFSNIRSGRWCPTCGHMDRLSSSKSKVRQRYEAYDR